MTKDNVFTTLANREHENDTKLGMPSTDLAHFHRRMHLMSTLRVGKGFGQSPKGLKRDAQGLTRGDRKRLRRQVVNERVSEERQPQFMHSAARRRFDAAMAVAA